MTHARQVAGGSTDFDRVWSARPAFLDAFVLNYLGLIERLDPALMELCRLKVAQIAESRFDLNLRYVPAQAALSEEKIAALGSYERSPLYSEKERQCLLFAELFAMTPYEISDSDAAKVKQHMSDVEFVHLVKALSVADQMARANSAFGIEPDGVPAKLQGKFVAKQKLH